MYPNPFDGKPAFNLDKLEESTYYLICEYQSILSPTFKPQKWYQTWLPFRLSKSSQEGKVYVAPGELKFKEVTEEKRIDAFNSRSKPK